MALQVAYLVPRFVQLAVLDGELHALDESGQVWVKCFDGTKDLWRRLRIDRAE